MLLQLAVPRAVPPPAPLLPPARPQGAEGVGGGRHAVEPGVALARQVRQEVGSKPARDVDAQRVTQRGEGRARTLGGGKSSWLAFRISRYLAGSDSDPDLNPHFLYSNDHPGSGSASEVQMPDPEPAAITST